MVYTQYHKGQQQSGVYNEHPVLAKGNWGPAVRLQRIRDTTTTDVPPPADA
jgi:hypothetical protein